MTQASTTKPWIKFTAFAAFAATTLIFSPNTSYFSGMQLDVANIGHFIFPMFIAVVITSGVLAIFFHGRNPTALRNYTFLVVAAALHAGMAALFSAFAYGFSPGVIALAMAGILYGISLVIICLAWAHILGCTEFRNALLYSALVCIIAYILAMALGFVPTSIRGACYLILVVMGTFAPVVFLRHESPVELEPNSTTSTSDLVSTLRLPGIGLLLFAFMMSISKTRLLDTFDAEHIAGLIASCLILLLFSIRTEKPLSAFVYRIIAPSIGGVVIVLLALPSSIVPSNATTILVYIFLSALAILALANILAIIYAGEFSSEFVASVGLFAGSAVSLAGIAWTQLVGGPSDITPVVFLLIAIYCALMMISLGWESWKLVTSPTDERSDSSTAKQDQKSWRKRAEEAKLTKREIEILELVGRGHSIIYIAEKLFISESTVRTHVKHIYAKLDIHTKEELFAFIDQE